MGCGTNKEGIAPVLKRVRASGLLAASIEPQAAEKHEDPAGDPRNAYALGPLSNVPGGLKRGTMALGNLGSERAQAGVNAPPVFPTSSVSLRLRRQPTDETPVQPTRLDGVPGEPDNPRGTPIPFNDGDATRRAAEAGFIPLRAKNAEALGLAATDQTASGVWPHTLRIEGLAETGWAIH